MKKRFFWLVLLALAVFVAGCGSKAASGPVEAIKERGVLRVGVKNDVPKFGYLDPSTNVIDGFEIDLARAIAKEIIGDPEKIEVTPVTANTRGELLNKGEIDLVIATFTITEQRKEQFNFSDPYFTDGIGLLVKKDSGIRGLADLDGKTIGVAQSATTAERVGEKAEEAGIKVEFNKYATYPEIKAALDSGRVDAFSVDGAILMGYIDDTTELLPERLSEEHYGIASKKENTELAELVNKVLNDLSASGELNQLMEKWGIQ